MDNNLEFLETYTVEQFKAKELISKLEVKKNPNSGKLFFSYGGKQGAVSAKGIPEKPMVSLVRPQNDPTANPFYLLHNEGNGGAPVLATL